MALVAYQSDKKCNPVLYKHYILNNYSVCIHKPVLVDLLQQLNNSGNQLVYDISNDINVCAIICQNTSFINKDGQCYTFENQTESNECPDIQVKIEECPDKKYCVTSCLDIQQLIYQNNTCVKECPGGFQNINNICTVVFPKNDNSSTGQPLVILLGIAVSILFAAILGIIYVLKMKIKSNRRLAEQSSALLDPVM